MASRTGEGVLDQTGPVGLASMPLPCNCAVMDSKRNSLAGGFFIATGAVGGSLVGAHYGQMSAGLLIGLAVGVLIAVLVWYLDSRA